MTESSRLVIMHQRWQHLGFFHWSAPPADVARLLPRELEVDTYGGRAWIGLVAFAMRDIRVRSLPVLPGFRFFLEVNVRTYVTLPDGTPAVWFFSLDGTNVTAAWTARTLFALPYWFAHGRATLCDAVAGSTVEFEAARSHSEHAHCECRWTVAPGAEPAQRGSLPYFLVERYVLVSKRGTRLSSTRVQHAPYEVAEAEGEIRDRALLDSLGLSLPATPESILYSPGVSVLVEAPQPFRVAVASARGPLQA